MSTCKACGKEVIQQKNKRRKEYCNSTCRSGLWHKVNRRENKAKEGGVNSSAVHSAKRVIKEEGRGKELATEQNSSVVIVKKVTDNPKVAFEEQKQHKKYKEGDPPQGSNAFFLRYGAFNYCEVKEGK